MKHFHNKEAKTLLENFFSLSILQIASYIFPLITLPYLSRTIGIDGFGEIGFALSIVMYFETITVFGFNYTAVRDISKNKGDIKQVSYIFSTTMVAKGLLMIVSFIILCLLLYIIPTLRDKMPIILYTFLIVPANVLFPDWFFQGIEKMKYITFLNFTSRTIFTLMVFIVIKDKADYIYQPILNSLGMFISGIISLYYIRKKLKIQFIVPSVKDLWMTIKKSSDMFLSLFFPNLYTNFSISLLGMTKGIGEVGILSCGKKFIDLSEQAFGIFSRTFFPFLARRKDKHTIYSRFTFILSVFASIILYLFADILVRLFYTPDFIPSATIIRIMSVSPIFLNLMNTYGINYLVLHNKENILRNIIIFCSLGGFILTWIFTTKYGSIGVAITITVVWGLRGILTLLYALKIKRKIDLT